jgi:hypothetical protein
VVTGNVKAEIERENQLKAREKYHNRPDTDTTVTNAVSTRRSWIDGLTLDETGLES